MQWNIIVGTLVTIEQAQLEEEFPGDTRWPIQRHIYVLGVRRLSAVVGNHHMKILKKPISTLYVLDFSEEIKTSIYISCLSSTLTCHGQLKSFLVQDQDLPSLHSQYHGWWCPGDARSQGISNHDINLVKPRLLGPRMLMVKCLVFKGC